MPKKCAGKDEKIADEPSNQLFELKVKHDILFCELEDLKKVVHTITERNLKQDTVIAMIMKLIKLSPLILLIGFIMQAALYNHSTIFDKWFDNEMKPFIEQHNKE